jgi:membrane protease YdiL (CAAX protease family)
LWTSGNSPSATAGIGEEIFFRLFVMGLWAFLLNLALKRWQARSLALWIGNVIASMAFGAAHLPATRVALGVKTPIKLPSIVITEVLVLRTYPNFKCGTGFQPVNTPARCRCHTILG